MALACYPSTQQVEAGGLGVQGYPWLSSKFEASLDYVRICLQNQKAEVNAVQKRMESALILETSKQLSWPLKVLFLSAHSFIRSLIKKQFPST